MAAPVHMHDTVLVDRPATEVAAPEPATAVVPNRDAAPVAV